VRVGNAVGEGVPEHAARRTAIAAMLAALATGILSLLLIALALPVVAMFPATGPVHHLAAAMLALWAPFILFDGVQVVLVYALRSLGDQVMAGVNGIVAFFVITGGLGVLLVHGGHGPNGLVLASGLGMVAAALLHGLRFGWVSRRSRWRS
jgi:MATE family multidrug resistance protein